MANETIKHIAATEIHGHAWRCIRTNSLHGKPRLSIQTNEDWLDCEALAGIIIDRVHKHYLDEAKRLESLIAELGEVAAAAAYHSRQAVESAREAGRRADYINAKAMNYFDPSYSAMPHPAAKKAGEA